jgi:hypothetical protein
MRHQSTAAIRFVLLRSEINRAKRGDPTNSGCYHAPDRAMSEGETHLSWSNPPQNHVKHGQHCQYLRGKPVKFVKATHALRDHKPGKPDNTNPNRNGHKTDHAPRRDIHIRKGPYKVLKPQRGQCKHQPLDHGNKAKPS